MTVLLLAGFGLLPGSEQAGRRRSSPISNLVKKDDIEMISIVFSSITHFQQVTLSLPCKAQIHPQNAISGKSYTAG